jgi:ADP-ribose pyrophosphatase YjhB (NUDIX family)
MAEGPQAESARVLAVGGVVVDRAGRVLLVRRARPPMMGAWTLPGGHVEEGESLETAIVREVREETAIATRLVCPLGVVNITRDRFAYAIHEHLLIPLADQTPRAGDDAAEARWSARHELPELGVLPDATEVIDRGLVEACRRGLTTRC